LLGVDRGTALARIPGDLDPSLKPSLAFLSRHELWYGREEPPVESRSLTAGPVSAELKGADLRYIRAGEIELLRRLYVAVRDHNWKTITAEVTELDLQEKDDSFAVRYAAFCRTDEIDLRWSCVIEGQRDGTITAEMVVNPGA
jgi:D-apionolactonase